MLMACCPFTAARLCLCRKSKRLWTRFAVLRNAPAPFLAMKVIIRFACALRWR